MCSKNKEENEEKAKLIELRIACDKRNMWNWMENPVSFGMGTNARLHHTICCWLGVIDHVIGKCKSLCRTYTPISMQLLQLKRVYFNYSWLWQNASRNTNLRSAVSFSTWPYLIRFGNSVDCVFFAALPPPTVCVFCLIRWIHLAFNKPN